MKKAVRIIIPLLLAIVVIGTAVWYLFVYDQNFTRDMLLNGARYMEANGKHSVAAWLYNCAYTQAGGSDEVAIELAQQYRNGGNYTKAEYTLSKAIANGGSPALYTALCKTYVEQDKLLDAVNFLNSITDPEIKAEMDALRPSVPAVSMEPGFYNYYLTVEVAGEGGTLYATCDGTYPSVWLPPYSAPFSLGGGENTVYALVVADSGLVSPLGIFGYTVGGIIEEVVFADSCMEQALRELIKIPEGTAVMTNDLWEVTKFTVPAGAKDYADLRHLLFLEDLTVENGISKQLSSISSLSHLQSVTVVGTPVYPDEIQILGKLPKLTHLTLRECSLSTVAGLENATELTYVDLSSNSIRDMSPLSSCTKLEKAYLQHNAVETVESISGCAALTSLNVSYNSIASIAPLSVMKALTELDASNNNLTDVSTVGLLAQLKSLNISYNKISDVSNLAACVLLEKLNISNNELTDIADLAALTDIMELDFSYNEITQLPEFQKSCTLVVIDGSYNKISSLDTLAGLPNLNKVYMDYNKEISSVEPLASCPNIILVNVYGTKVKKVTSLTSQSVVVNFTPV